MGLFSLIKKLVSINETAETDAGRQDLVFIHEDYVQQIELGPAENRNYYLSQIKRIADKSDPDSNGYGFGTIAIRTEPPVKLLSRKINVSHFKNKFIERSFSLKQVCYSGFPNLKIEELAFVKGDFQVFCGYKDKNIRSIYFNNINDTSQEDFNSIVSQLSTEYDLVLIDWWLGDVYKTENEIELARFHNRYKKQSPPI